MKVQIIAELAQGFEGRPDQARLLLRAAVASGADAAKFQLVYADELATPDYKHYGLFRTLEMTDEVWADLAAYAREQHIELQFDIFGLRSLALASAVGAEALKVHPTDIVNVGLLTGIAASSVPKVLLGIGGADWPEIAQALDILGNKDVVLLVGFQGYPTATDANQIARVRLLAHRVAARPRVQVGFADHADPESQLRLALAAVALGAGARVFEKHLTLSSVMKMEDHESALNPDGFAAFVAAMRDCAKAYGFASAADDFGMAEGERTYRSSIRRHVVTSRALPVGHRIGPQDVLLKRSSAAEPLTDLSMVYSRVLTQPLGANVPITMADLHGEAAR